MAERSGAINPRVDPVTGEYMDIVGDQLGSQWNVEASPEDTSQHGNNEDHPPA